MPTHPIPEAIRINPQPGTYIELIDPKRIEKDPSSLRFSLVIGLEGEPWLTMEGWRVTKRRLVPPARKSPSGYIPLAQIEAADSKRLALIMFQQWGDSFPGILWPNFETKTSDES